MKYEILLPPIRKGDVIYDSGTIELTEAEAQPLLATKVIRPTTAEAETDPASEEIPQVQQPTTDEAPTNEASPEIVTQPTETEDSLIHLNSMSEPELVEALVALEHIGPAIAQKMVAARPFDSLDAARKVSGLTVKQWSEIVHNLAL